MFYCCLLETCYFLKGHGGDSGPRGEGGRESEMLKGGESVGMYCIREESIFHKKVK